MCEWVCTHVGDLKWQGGGSQGAVALFVSSSYGGSAAGDDQPFGAEVGSQCLLGVEGVFLSGVLSTQWVPCLC